MSDSARTALPVRVLKAAGVGVLVVLALVVILTALRTELPRNPGVMSDALGPDHGEPVAEYLDRAAASLGDEVVGGGDDAVAGGGGAADDRDDDNDTSSLTSAAPRWALVSAAQAWTTADAEAVALDLPRVSGLMVQVPVDGVAMPVTEVVLTEPVAGESSRGPVMSRGLKRAADGLEAAPPGSAGPASGAGLDPGADAGRGVDVDRAAATAALTATRIRAGAPAIIGLVVRATPGQLREVARLPGVRAVEALPADAVWGRFAVRPLQPQFSETASPLPDTAPIPTS